MRRVINIGSFILVGISRLGHRAGVLWTHLWIVYLLYRHFALDNGILMGFRLGFRQESVIRRWMINKISAHNVDVTEPVVPH